MVSLPVDAISHFSDLHVKPINVKYAYGTAGFRTEYVFHRLLLDWLTHSSVVRAAVLDSVLFRVGVLAALRSKRLDGKTIGVMVTASHNPEPVRVHSSDGRLASNV
jgi:phosphoacetylglucosamine mutase